LSVWHGDKGAQKETPPSEIKIVFQKASHQK
jgi:hypothetical protein